MTIAIINNGGENISSLVFAIQRLGKKAILTENINIIKKADRVILPGVGAANNAMNILEEKSLIDCIKNLTQPVLGICLGMQILFEKSQEGNICCLGIIDGIIKKIPQKTGFTIPHMGWNNIQIKQINPLLKGIKNKSYFYFVHSFYAPLLHKYTLASTDYIIPITAIINKNNFYGCQFHPEKSGESGAKILKNFLEI